MLQDDICKTDVIPAIKTDHSAINLVFKSVEAHKTGPAYWKISSSFTEDPTYINLTNRNYSLWLAEYNDITDIRVLWNLIKYKITQETIKFGKQKARERKAKLYFLENQLKIAEEKVASNPNDENIVELENWKSKYELSSTFVCARLVQLNMGLINKVDMVCLSPVGYGV